MKRLISAILFVSLCSPHVALAAQGTSIAPTPEYWYAYASKLPIGAVVQVRTADGKRQTATLALVEPDGITLEARTRIPEPPRRVRYADIQQLSLKQNGTNLAKAVAIGAGVGAGFFLVLLALLASNWD